MEGFITYSLKRGENNSDRFYKDIAAFTDEVLGYADGLTKHLVGDYQSYVKSTGLEKVRNWEEYSFELLVMGVLWNTYGENAQRLPGIAGRLLSGLTGLRMKSVRLKPIADYIRGILGALLLFRTGKGDREKAIPQVSGISKLLVWMEAAGEFTQEIKRLRNWEAFFYAIPGAKAGEYLKAAVCFADWFEINGRLRLGSYTANVESYISGEYLKHRWREDKVFCGRKEQEYHMNMVGAEIMNRAFREEFSRVRERVVLLPSCMRVQPESACRAVLTDSGYHCTSCTEGCRVSELTKMGKTCGFEVYIVHHESSAFKRWMSKPVKDGEIGIVGVVCALNLVSGGWKAKYLDMPPQCVFLDYCGCRNHWDENGIVTDINMNQLERILDLRF